MIPILALWMSFGKTRWGMRIWVSLIALALIWEWVLDYSDAHALSNTAMSIELLSVLALSLTGWFFIEGFDTRLIDVYQTSNDERASNAEVNIVDLLCCTFGIAITMSIVSRHPFRQANAALVVSATLQATVLAAISLTVLWAVLSMTALWKRILVSIAGCGLNLWICGSLIPTSRGPLPSPTLVFVVSTAVVVSLCAVLLFVCGYRLGAVENPTADGETS